ncbi:MAG: sulfatase-like hydrolase/transferase [Rikenellaceae bacterium]
MNTKTLLALGGCTLSAVAAMAAEKPNLLIIHTDEHSFRTLSCYQALLPEEQAFVWGKGVNSTTPNIDKIAKAGAICTSYYCATPVSTPSRASLISGLYPEFTGAPVNGDYIREDIPTLGTILRDNGYSTSYVGKWHLAGDDFKYTFGIKYNGGFDDNRYMMTGGHAPYLQIKDGEIIASGLGSDAAEKIPADELVHYTDFFTDKGLEIMERDKDKPFCLMVSIPDPHTPDYARPPYHTMYEDMQPQAPSTMTEEIYNNRPNWASAGKNLRSEFDPEALKQYLGMVKHIDDNVGRMISFLEENGLMENTIVVFTSDHGDMFFEHSRMNKGVPYEASARVPFVISYPDKIPAGKVISTSYVNTDFTPTMLALMGIESDVYFHGEDTSKDLTSKKKSVDKPRFVYFRAVGGSWASAVEGQYKLVLDRKDVPYLFDLESDPFEVNNIAEEPKYRKIASRMKEELLKRLEEVDTPNRAYNTGNL